jgi:hypothetical protein
MKEIIENTGYSYSGVSDLLREQPERKLEFLECVNDEFKRISKLIDDTERELRIMKADKMLHAQCFVYAAQVLSDDKKTLTFKHGDNLVMFKTIDDTNYRYQEVNINVK